MSNRDHGDRKRGAFAKLPGSYEVGYGRPPEKTQFAKGQSGNPAGRPRGSKNKPVALDGYALRDLILSEVNRNIEVNERSEMVSIPMVQAVMRKIGFDALRGRARAQELFMKLAGNAAQEVIKMQERLLETLCTYKAEWERELAHRAYHGITRFAEPLPHPDDIFVDMTTGEVEVRGPMTAEEAAQYEAALDRLTMLQEGLPRLEAFLTGLRKSRQRTSLEVLREQTCTEIAEIEAVLPAAYIARKRREAADREAASEE